MQASANPRLRAATHELTWLQTKPGTNVPPIPHHARSREVMSYPSCEADILQLAVLRERLSDVPAAEARGTLSQASFTGLLASLATAFAVVAWVP